MVAPGKPVVERDVPVTRTQLAALVSATLPGLAGSTRDLPKVRTHGSEAQIVTRATHKPWKDLYKLLIAPVAADLPQDQGSLLTIIPQGPLLQLSFAAPTDGNRRYLIEKHALNMAPSVSTLQVTAKNEAAASVLAARYVVLANPEEMPAVNGVPLPPLPGTQVEAAGIEREIGGKPLTLLEGKDAGLDALRRALPATTVVHFATHAVVSDRAHSMIYALAA